MIRLFLTTVLMLTFAVGCGYFWWQSSQLRADNAKLHAEVAQLKKQEIRRYGRRHEAASVSPLSGGQKSSTGVETEENAAAEGWLALANEHADKAKVAFNAHNYGVAQQEASLAVDDARRATDEPVQATQSTLAQVRGKIAQLESSVGGIVHQGAGGSGH